MRFRLWVIGACTAGLAGAMPPNTSLATLPVGYYGGSWPNKTDVHTPIRRFCGAVDRHSTQPAATPTLRLTTPACLRCRFTSICSRGCDSSPSCSRMAIVGSSAAQRSASFFLSVDNSPSAISLWYDRASTLAFFPSRYPRRVSLSCTCGVRCAIWFSSLHQPPRTLINVFPHVIQIAIALSHIGRC